MSDEGREILDETSKKADGSAKRYRVRLKCEFYIDVAVPADNSEHAKRILSNDLMPDTRQHLIETADWKALYGKQFEIGEPKPVDQASDRDIPNLSELLRWDAES
jgi:hypothetical protein